MGGSLAMMISSGIVKYAKAEYATCSGR